MRKLFLTTAMLLVAAVTMAAVEQDVTIECPWGALSATLAVPETGSDTAVVIVAGSGPTDRNGNSGMNLNSYSYKLLSDGLVESGFAVLRYDKRAIGRSAIAPELIPDLVFEDFVEDAAECVKYLRGRGFERVIMAGHSEGGLISLVVATQHREAKLDGVVLLCAPGYSIDVVLRQQLSAQLIPSYMGLMLSADIIINKLKSGTRVEEKDIPKELISLFHPVVQPFLISNMQYDPEVLARGCELPMLVITGGNDIQVSVDNGTRIVEAAPNATHVTFEKMTHVLKDFESKDRVEQVVGIYVNSQAPINEGVVKHTVEFINTINR